MANKKFSLDHLSDTVFEEFCYDLLQAMGFSNVQWRKGTGLGTSPADQGRDIECELIRDDIDGARLVEKWFVECKHYKQGVAPTKIEGALAWATAERPDVLLLIASNFFSNPTKEYLQKYKENNKPNFRVKQWELPDLQRSSKDKLTLATRYGLPQDHEFLSIMHPAHLQYIRKVQINTLEFLFKCFDGLESHKRDEITSWLWEPIIKPRTRKPLNDNESYNDLLLDPISYEIFKDKCREMVKPDSMESIWLTSFIVSYLLQATFAHGDTTLIESRTREQRDTLEFMTKLERIDPSKRDLITSARPRFEEHLRQLPERVKKGHEIYMYFCEEVIVKLLSEPSLISTLSKT